MGQRVEKVANRELDVTAVVRGPFLIRSSGERGRVLLS